MKHRREKKNYSLEIKAIIIFSILGIALESIFSKRFAIDLWLKGLINYWDALFQSLRGIGIIGFLPLFGILIGGFPYTLFYFYIVKIIIKWIFK